MLDVKTGTDGTLGKAHVIEGKLVKDNTGFVYAGAVVLNETELLLIDGAVGTLGNVKEPTLPIVGATKVGFIPLKLSFTLAIKYCKAFVAAPTTTRFSYSFGKVANPEPTEAEVQSIVVGYNTVVTFIEFGEFSGAG